MDSSQHANAPKPNRPFPTSPEPAGAELPWPPPLYVAGDPPPGRPRPIRDHPKVRPDPLSLFPLFPLAASKETRQILAARSLLCFEQSARDSCGEETKVLGPKCKMYMNFKAAKL